MTSSSTTMTSSDMTSSRLPLCDTSVSSSSSERPLSYNELAEKVTVLQVSGVAWYYRCWC